MLGPADTLIVVDVQNDFLPGGSLPVSHGDEVIHMLNRYLRRAEHAGMAVFATRDWHPPNHCSFASRGGPWPPHCIAGSRGAEFAPGLALPISAIIVSKATDPDRDAYSGFQGTDLDHLLKAREARRLWIGGLATGHCVLNTVKDALSLG